MNMIMCLRLDMKFLECQKIKVIICKSSYKGANGGKCDNNLCSVIAEDKDEFIII